MHELADGAAHRRTDLEDGDEAPRRHGDGGRDDGEEELRWGRERDQGARRERQEGIVIK